MAKQLLAEAGHPDGIDVEIATKQDPPWELATVQAMVEQWKDAGIRVSINSMPSASFWDVWDKVPFGFTSWTHRPLGFMVLGLAYRTGVPWNESRYANPEFDAILTKAEVHWMSMSDESSFASLKKSCRKMGRSHNHYGVPCTLPGATA